MGLFDSIEKAWNSLTENKEEKPNEAEKSTESGTDKVSEEKKAEGKPEEGKSEENAGKAGSKPDLKTERALELFDRLSDPETTAETLALLTSAAQNRGLLKTETGREEATESLLDILKKSVSEENHYMVDALAPGLEKIFEKLSKGQEVSTKKLETQILSITEKEQLAENEKFVEGLLESEKYKDYLDEMNTLMEEIPPSEGVDIEKYLDRLLRVAKAEHGDKKTEEKEKRTAEKVKQNLEERTPSSKAKNADDVVIVNKKVNLEEAIDFALKGQKVRQG